MLAELEEIIGYKETDDVDRQALIRTTWKNRYASRIVLLQKTTILMHYLGSRVHREIPTFGNAFSKYAVWQLHRKKTWKCGLNLQIYAGKAAD